MEYRPEDSIKIEYHYRSRKDVTKDLELYSLRVKTKKMQTKEFIKYCKEHGETVKTAHMLSPNIHLSNDGNETVVIFRNIDDEIETVYKKETAFLKSDFTVTEETLTPMKLNTNFNNRFKFQYTNNNFDGLNGGVIEAKTVQDIVDFIYNNPSPETLKITSFDKKTRTTSTIYNGEKATHMVQIQRATDDYQMIDYCDTQERIRKEVEETVERHIEEVRNGKQMTIFLIVIVGLFTLGTIAHLFVPWLFS